MSLGGLYLEGLIFGILPYTVRERLLLYACPPDKRALITKQGALLNGKFKMDLMYSSGQLTSGTNYRVTKHSEELNIA